MKNLLLLIAVTSLFFGCNNTAVDNAVESVEIQSSTGEPDGPHTVSYTHLRAHET